MNMTLPAHCEMSLSWDHVSVSVWSLFRALRYETAEGPSIGWGRLSPLGAVT